MPKSDNNGGVLIVDSADKVPPVPARPPHQLIDYTASEKPRPRSTVPPQVWIIATVAIVLPLAVGLFAFWRWLEARPWLADALGYGVAGLLLLGLVGAAVGVFDWLQARRAKLAAEALQAAVLRTRLGTAARSSCSARRSHSTRCCRP